MGTIFWSQLEVTIVDVQTAPPQNVCIDFWTIDEKDIFWVNTKFLKLWHDPEPSPQIDDFSLLFLKKKKQVDLRYARLRVPYHSYLLFWLPTPLFKCTCSSPLNILFGSTFLLLLIFRFTRFTQRLCEQNVGLMHACTLLFSINKVSYFYFFFSDQRLSGKLGWKARLKRSFRKSMSIYIVQI